MVARLYQKVSRNLKAMVAEAGLQPKSWPGLFLGSRVERRKPPSFVNHPVAAKNPPREEEPPSERRASSGDVGQE